MNESTFRRYSILSQAGLLLVFFLINLVENIGECSLIEAVVYALNYTFMVAGVVIIHYFYLLPLYLNNKRVRYFISLFLLMSGFIVLYYIIDLCLPFEYDESEALDPFDPMGLAYDYLILIITTAYTSMYYFVEQWFRHNVTASQLRSEKLQAELNFLKSQINPHFLFNTLNNIYSYAQTGNEKTALMLERLSSILRFMVYDCGENRVGLTKEIAAVEDLLEIHKMKNSEQLNINLSVNGVKRLHLIAPLIIVNFVENACKHSDVVSNKDGFINIKVVVDEKDYCFLDISNTFQSKTTGLTKYSGLGLENTKKRLDLQYGDDYQLSEKITDNIYHLQLRTPLERKQ